MTARTEGPYDGQNWPTHSISVWIENDSIFVDTALNYAKMDETGYGLRKYVYRLLFDRNALALQERHRLTRDAVRTLDAVVGELGLDGEGVTALEAFGTVNWKYVRDDLLS